MKSRITIAGRASVATVNVSAEIRAVRCAPANFSDIPQTPILRMEQPPPYHEQVCQSRRHLEAVQVLGEAAVAGLTKSEHVLDHPDRVLDFSPHLRFGPVLGFGSLVKPAAPAVLAVREVLGSRRSRMNQ